MTREESKGREGERVGSRETVERGKGRESRERRGRKRKKGESCSF